MIIPAAIKDKDKIYLAFQFYQKQMIKKKHEGPVGQLLIMWKLDYS